MTATVPSPASQAVFPDTARVPLWLLDFDGVMNAITRTDKPDRTIWPDWVRTDIFSTQARAAFPVWYSPTVVGFVTAAHAAGVEIAWLSTWQADTAAFPDAIPGMPRLPWLPEPVPAGAGWWWKHQVAEERAADRPLVWADDDLTQWAKPYRQAWVWAEKRAHTLAVAPAEATGLTPRRLRAIARFLAEHGYPVPGWS